MRAIPASVRAAVGPALDAGASEIAAAQRSLAPRGEGALIASIQVEAGPHDLARTVRAGGESTTRPVREGVSATFDYALGQEFGTAKMPARPFFFAGYRLARKRAAARIRRAIARAFREAT